MNVLVLGGAGNQGRGVSRLLAGTDLVTELIVAGRRLEAADQVAAQLGEKARAAQVDVHDEPRLRTLMAGCDLVVQAGGPHFEVLVPTVRAALQAGVHVCDVSDGGRSIRRALALDAEARAAGITGLIGVGLSPGLTNLLALHAYRQLDRVEDLEICWVNNGPLNSWRGATLLSLLDSASGVVPTFGDGTWVDIVGHEHGVDVTLPGGGTVHVYPSGFPEPVTLPRSLPGLRSVSHLVGYLPERVGDLFADHVRQVAAGQCTVAAAQDRFCTACAAEPAAATAAVPAVPAFTWYVRASGTKAGRRARLTCTSPLTSTEASLVAAALKLLRGDITQRGVLAPEACLEPQSFFRDVAALLPESRRPADGALIAERWD